MRIEEAEKEEIEEFIDELWLPLAKEMEKISSYHELSEDAREGMKKFRKEQIDKEDRVTYVLKDDGEYIGFATAKIKEVPPIFTEDMICNVSEIFVKEDYRREGHASKLLTEVEKWARSEGCRAIELSVDSDNLIAIDLYENSGFKEIRKRMRKEL